MKNVGDTWYQETPPLGLRLRMHAAKYTSLLLIGMASGVALSGFLVIGISCLSYTRLRSFVRGL